MRFMSAEEEEHARVLGPAGSASRASEPALSAAAVRRARWQQDRPRSDRRKAAESLSDMWFAAVSGESYNELPTFPIRPSYSKFQS